MQQVTIKVQSPLQLSGYKFYKFSRDKGFQDSKGLSRITDSNFGIRPCLPWLYNSKVTKITIVIFQLSELFFMTYYFRILGHVFEKAGIEVTSENRSTIDQVIHAIVGVEYKNCPAVGRAVKEFLTNDEDAFVAALQASFRSP